MVGRDCITYVDGERYVQTDGLSTENELTEFGASYMSYPVDDSVTYGGESVGGAADVRGATGSRYAGDPARHRHTS